MTHHHSIEIKMTANHNQSINSSQSLFSSFLIGCIYTPTKKKFFFYLNQFFTHTCNIAGQKKINKSNTVKRSDLRGHEIHFYI